MAMRMLQPWWLLSLLVLLPWIWWVSRRSWTDLGPVRWWASHLLRALVLILLVAALAGLQWLDRHDRMAVIYALDRSLSIPARFEEQLLRFIQENSQQRKQESGDQVGLLVFGGTASLELPSEPKPMVLERIFSIVDRDSSDIAGALRLASAAFPEHVQKRVVLISDGNQTQGDALAEALEAKAAGVSVDVLPITYNYQREFMAERVDMPSTVQEGERFEARLYLNASQAAEGTLWLTRNGRRLQEQRVQLTPGRNLYSFQETLNEPGFYSYEVVLEVDGDSVPQNNRAIGYTSVRGRPRMLLVESDPAQAQPLIDALRQIEGEIVLLPVDRIPETLAQLQDFDLVLMSNVSAGSLSIRQMRMLQSAARDFGVGIVAIGGDESFTAGGYRGTPLEEMLPVSMDLSSKKVLPSGALVLIMHTTEFPGGNDWARQTALASLEALGPRDQLGVLLWAGQEQWLFPVGPVGDKAEKGGMIQRMNPGDMPDFDATLEMAHKALKETQAHLKHIIVFSDGDPSGPALALLDRITADKITVSTVMIGPHPGTNGPEKMAEIAQRGKGRYWDVRRPEDLPQIFIKEAAVILKSSIFEEPFTPEIHTYTEPLRGLDGFPQMLGYVATSPKPRAELALVSEKGDPLLAHWQYGLGRTVAFTSDAKARWAAPWMGWPNYGKFWAQVSRWAFRQLQSSDFEALVEVQGTEGKLRVDALDERGNYLNFLELKGRVVDPDGESREILLEQSGPGQYEAVFPAGKVGAYMVNLVQEAGGQVVSTQVVGTAQAYSPEFQALEASTGTLEQIAQATDGQVLDSLGNPFEHDRRVTEVPKDLMERLLIWALILFLLDVGVRRVMLERSQWLAIRAWCLRWIPTRKTAERDEALSLLLERKAALRRQSTRPAVERPQAAAAPEPAVGKAPSRRKAAGKSTGVKPKAPKPVVPPEEAEPTEPSAADPRAEEGATSFTQQLLEAKKRAREKRGL